MLGDIPFSLYYIVMPTGFLCFLLEVPFSVCTIRVVRYCLAESSVFVPKSIYFNSELKHLIPCALLKPLPDDKFKTLPN